MCVAVTGTVIMATGPMISLSQQMTINGWWHAAILTLLRVVRRCSIAERKC